MSTHKRRWKDPKGKEHSAWVVQVEAEAPNGKMLRHREQNERWSQQEAKAREHEVFGQIRAGTYGKQEVQRKEMPTVTLFSDEFVKTYATANNKASEVYTKESCFKAHLRPAFGDKKLDEIGPREIERYKAEKLTQKLSKKSINNHLTVLRKMLGVAVEWGILNAVPKFKLLKAPKPEFDFLDFDEAVRLIAAAEEPWKTEIIVALRTGLRHGELHGLRWDDVDLVAGRLVVRQSLWRKQFQTPKNGKEREIPLSDDAIAALKRHRHLKGELVFSEADGKLLLATACKWPLWRACKKAGLRPIQWHVLRHTFASHLVMRGVPLKAVMELMGHSTIEMTMRYAHLAPATKREAVMLLDAPPPTVHAQYMEQVGVQKG